MTEIEFERAVVDLAHLFGWRAASFRPAGTGKGWRTPVKYDGKGYPDLTLVHADGCVIFAEMKSATGQLSDDQKAWGEALAQAEEYSWSPDRDPSYPIRYRVWKPSNGNQIASALSFGRVMEWTP